MDAMDRYEIRRGSGLLDIATNNADQSMDEESSSSFTSERPFRNNSIVEKDTLYLSLFKELQNKLLRLNNKSPDGLLDFLDYFLAKVRQESKLCRSKPVASSVLARRIIPILVAVRDINQKYVFNAAYFKKISRILAVYMDLELKGSIKGREFLRIITNRIVLHLEYHLSVHSKHDCNYILDSFVHMERIMKAHKEILDILFQRYLRPKKEHYEMLPLTDRMYVTHLVLFKKWKDIEMTSEGRKKINDICLSTIKPKMSIANNPKFAPYLPIFADKPDPTAYFMSVRFKLEPIIDALKTPDFDDHFGIESLNLGTLTTSLDVSEKYLESTSSASSSTQITSSSNSLQNCFSSSAVSLMQEPLPSSFPPPLETAMFPQPLVCIKTEMPIQDCVVDLTEDEFELADLSDPLLNWVKSLSKRCQDSLMLPPRSLLPSRQILNTEIIDVDEFVTKPSYMTSPTDSGVTSSGRNTRCSWIEGESSDGGLISESDEQQDNLRKQKFHVCSEVELIRRNELDLAEQQRILRNKELEQGCSSGSAMTYKNNKRDDNNIRTEKTTQSSECENSNNSGIILSDNNNKNKVILFKFNVESENNLAVNKSICDELVLSNNQSRIDQQFVSTESEVSLDGLDEETIVDKAVSAGLMEPTNECSTVVSGVATSNIVIGKPQLSPELVNYLSTPAFDPDDMVNPEYKRTAKRVQLTSQSFDLSSEERVNIEDNNLRFPPIQRTYQSKKLTKLKDYASQSSPIPSSSQYVSNTLSSSTSSLSATKPNLHTPVIFSMKPSQKPAVTSVSDSPASTTSSSNEATCSTSLGQVIYSTSSTNMTNTILQDWSKVDDDFLIQSEKTDEAGIGSGLNNSSGEISNSGSQILCRHSYIKHDMFDMDDRLRNSTTTIVTRAANGFTIKFKKEIPPVSQLPGSTIFNLLQKSGAIPDYFLDSQRVVATTPRAATLAPVPASKKPSSQEPPIIDNEWSCSSVDIPKFVGLPQKSKVVSFNPFVEDDEGYRTVIHPINLPRKSLSNFELIFEPKYKVYARKSLLGAIRPCYIKLTRLPLVNQKKRNNKTKKTYGRNNRLSRSKNAVSSLIQNIESLGNPFENEPEQHLQANEQNINTNDINLNTDNITAALESQTDTVTIEKLNTCIETEEKKDNEITRSEFHINEQPKSIYNTNIVDNLAVSIKDNCGIIAADINEPEATVKKTVNNKKAKKSRRKSVFHMNPKKKKIGESSAPSTVIYKSSIAVDMVENNMIQSAKGLEIVKTTIDPIDKAIIADEQKEKPTIDENSTLKIAKPETSLVALKTLNSSPVKNFCVLLQQLKMDNFMKQTQVKVNEIIATVSEDQIKESNIEDKFINSVATLVETRENKGVDSSATVELKQTNNSVTSNSETPVNRLASSPDPGFEQPQESPKSTTPMVAEQPLVSAVENKLAIINEDTSNFGDAWGTFKKPFISLKKIHSNEYNKIMFVPTYEEVESQSPTSTMDKEDIDIKEELKKPKPSTLLTAINRFKVRTKAVKKTFHSTSRTLRKYNKLSNTKKLPIKSAKNKRSVNIEKKDQLEEKAEFVTEGGVNFPETKSIPCVSEVQQTSIVDEEVKKDELEIQNVITSTSNIEECKVPEQIIESEPIILETTRSPCPIEEPMIIDFETQPNYLDVLSQLPDKMPEDEDVLRSNITGQNSNDMDHNNSVFDETQSSVSEEIPSPPFETVTPASNLETYNVRIGDQVLSSPPFEEVIDPKSFGTLENDSSISEMENVEKCVNENFHDDDNKSLFSDCDDLDELNLNPSNKGMGRHLYEDEIRYNMLLSSSSDVSTTSQNKINKRRNSDKKLSSYNLYDFPETIVSSTTLPNNHNNIGDQILFPGTNNSALLIDYSSYNTQKHKKHSKDPDQLRKPKKSKPKYTIGYIPVPKSKSLSQRGFLSKDINSEIPSSSSSPRSQQPPSFQADNKRTPKLDDLMMVDKTKARTNKNSFHSVFLDDLFKPDRISNPYGRNYRKQTTSGGSCGNGASHISNAATINKKTRTKTKNPSISPPLDLVGVLPPPTTKAFDITKTYSSKETTAMKNVFVPPDIENLIEGNSDPISQSDAIEYSSQNASQLVSLQHNYHHHNNQQHHHHYHYPQQLQNQQHHHHEHLPPSNCNFINISTLMNPQLNSNER